MFAILIHPGNDWYHHKGAQVEIDGKIFSPSILQGNNRIIVIHEDLVFKFDHPVDFEDSQCESEVKFWNDILQEQDKKYFAPLMHHGKNWVAQKRIEFADPIRSHTAYLTVLKLTEKYGLNDLSPNRNWGIEKSSGIPIIFDYGI